ncbi:hypothetical protein QUF81_09815 [Peribacillus simplex]|uniref:hypothetical protein n=1 Tax=Peribacillus simplex TaxID=1478 RepID=UPI0025A19F97|nr:hypothetical protein [Peribacillus simplex]MDM5293473.1 hypothetical protein [Peribacillus simplex]MDW7616261.1 hypothetical protein [Peribacillus simplex]
MKKQLLKISEREEFVELYSDTNDLRKFGVAKILKVSDAFVVAANITSTGLYDGYSLLYLESIHQINVNTKYIKKIKRLYMAKKQNHIEFVDGNEDLLLSFLDFAHENNFMVSVELFNAGYGDVQGFIKNLEDDIFVISMVNEVGELDGEAFIKSDAIHTITCDGENEFNLMHLYFRK